MGSRMKGIVHFVSGIAVATFFPEVVRAAAQGSLLPLVGGVAALIPDTLDFKIIRYFQHYDLEIDPASPVGTSRVADSLARLVDQAFRSQHRLRVKLHTVELGPDLWQQYTIAFDQEAAEISVRFGPAVSTGQQAVDSGHCSPEVPEVARVDVPFVLRCEAEHRVDIFDGPSFRFDPHPTHVAVEFLDWHRQFTHSIPFAFLLGLVTTAAWALVRSTQPGTQIQLSSWAGIVAGLGVVTHIAQDQIGHLGSALFYPVLTRKVGGFGLTHSTDPLPNLLFFLSSVATILANLARFSDAPKSSGWVLTAVAVALLLAFCSCVFIKWERSRSRRSGDGPKL